MYQVNGEGKESNDYAKDYKNSQKSFHTFFPVAQVYPAVFQDVISDVASLTTVRQGPAYSQLFGCVLRSHY